MHMYSMPRPRALLVAAAFLLTTIALLYSLPSSTTLAISYSQGKASKTLNLHLLTTATANDINICRLLLSAAVLSYPPVVLLDWHGEGEFNAAEDHLAKLRGPLRYFDSLPASSDDDLVLLVDGYDVIFQLGPDVLLQRYHETIRSSNARLEAQFGKEHVEKHSMYHTILYGPDVLCYPIDFKRPACWLVPESTLRRDIFGPETDRNTEHTRPRWLNSGTMLGPVRDVKKLFETAMENMNRTWNPDFYGRNSDQMYLADVWAEQEYVRMTSTGKDVAFPFRGALPDEDKPNVWTPEVKDREKAELHVAIDYESHLFQTVANFYDILKWNSFSQTHIIHSILGKAKAWSFPDDIANAKLPYRSLDLTWEDSGLKRKSWKDVALGLNIVTENIFPILHFTGNKLYRDMWWENMWFFSEADKLLKAKPDRGAIATIDGVKWMPYKPYGKESARQDTWADTGELLPWKEICGEHEEVLYNPYRPSPPEPDMGPEPLPPPKKEEEKNEKSEGEKNEEQSEENKDQEEEKEKEQSEEAKEKPKEKEESTSS